MFRINNNDFKILHRYKDFLNDLDNILENVPRKDMFFKDKIREVSLDLMHNFLIINNGIENINEYSSKLKADISLMDFLLERLYDKAYINEKALYKLGEKLIEINKMTTGFINSYVC